MKNKPQSHRSTNTFQFQGFHAKVKKIRVNARSFILQKAKLDDNEETFLWQTICEWREKNLTIVFQQFQDSLGNEFQTVAQLLLKESHIAEKIEEYLAISDDLSLPPLLESLLAFARDSPHSFYENHFGMFVKRLSCIVINNPRCHATIESVFVCFVSLFTLLQKYICTNFYDLYVKYEICTLLSKDQPWYINELCAQTLGSLIRRFPNKKDYLVMVLKRLQKNKDETEGVGRLLFHTMKSDVARRVHSSTPTILNLLFTMTLQEEIPLEESREAVVFCLKQILSHVTATIDVPIQWQETWKQDSEYVWPVLLKSANAAIETSPSPLSEISPLSNMLAFLFEVAQFRYSALVTDFSLVLQVLIAATQRPTNDEVGHQIGRIASKLLISTHYNVSPSLLKSFLASFFGASFSPSVIFGFISLVLDSNMFEHEIQPAFLDFIWSLLLRNAAKEETMSEEGNNDQNEEIKDGILSSLVTIVNSNVPPIRTATDLDSWSVYSLDFSRSLPDVVNGSASTQTPVKCLLESILAEGLRSDNTNLENLIRCCLCLPHISHLEKEDFVPYLFWIMSDAYEKVKRKTVPLMSEDPEPKKKKRKSLNTSELNFNISLSSDDTSRKLIFLASIVVETLYHIIPSEDSITAFAGQDPLFILMENPHYRENIHLLKIVDIYLSVQATEEDTKVFNEDTLKGLYALLAPSLASHKSLVRLLVSHIFSLFFLDESSVNPEQNLFLTMFEVESFPVSPLEYKERLRLLSNLEVDRVALSGSTSKAYREAPVLFLIGQLFINFKEFWAPCVKMLAKYAHYLPEDVFWPLWLSQLKLASHLAMRNLCNKAIEEESATTFRDSTLDSLHSDLISHPGCSHLVSKPNYLHFRDLLWETMQQFPDICEKRNKDVVTVFLDFLNKEYFPVDFNVAPTQDVSIHSEEEENQTVLKEEEDEGGQPPPPESEEESVDPRQRVRKAPTKSLCEHLKLFAKFHNPKVIFKSKELEMIYFEFLSHPYLKAQKLALDAIMTYNHKYLVPYRESLYNILDDKAFKNEITLFDIEGKGEDENRSLKEEHRKNFMPVLMRLLYGKMQYKTGSHTSGKSNLGSRKGIVFRFLAGANEEELDTFLNLSFDIMLNHLEGSVLEIVERVESTLDPKRVIPLKRMLGALGTLDTIFDKMGSLLERKRPFLLKVILLILSISVNLLENRNEVCSHFYPLLKNIRQMAMRRLVAFFTNYLNYNWSSGELEAVFRVAVWPNLERLPDEGIYSPTPLLRLFCCWGNHVSYHVLLARHHPEDRSLTPMPFLMKLINHQKCSSAVVDAVYNFVERLLKPAPEENDIDEDDSMPFELPKDFVLPLEEDAEELGFCELSLGESLVISCLEDLIANIKNNLVGLKRGQMIKNRDLTILMYLARWITNKKDAQELLDSIVPLLKKSCVKQSEKISFLLDTCTKLLGIVDDPEKYGNDFLCLFSVIDGRAPRNSLCRVIEALYANGDKSETVAKWGSRMNAWNEEMVEEIDADTRLNCYKEVNRHLKETDVFDEELLLFLIHQNVWVINHGKDQALIDLSILCLENVLNSIVRLHLNSSTSIKRIFDQHLLLLIRAGLKNSSEIVRNGILTILRFAVHKCHKFSSRLHDLHVLADVNDLDGDFFAAMAHLQRGRRTRALMRVAEQLNEGKLRLQTDSLTEFLLPIASVYLFKEEFATDANLLTSCIICVGAIAKQLPWYHYQNLLKHYLNLVSRELNQLRLGVRVLEVVIDAFHEDLLDFEEDQHDTLSTAVTGQDSEKMQPQIAGDDSDKMEQQIAGDDEVEHDETMDWTDEKENESDVSSSTKARKVKVYRSLTRNFLPQIQKTLAERSTRDVEHKLNKKKYPEDEDIKRIPLALALVKLLKKLPRKLMAFHVSSVLMKLISYLKSRAESIRKESRAMLVKVMEELGGEYLTNLVSDLRDLMTRGYQSHVMVYTLHAILTALQSSLTPAHIAPCIEDMMEICLEDMFGDKAEEKAVGQLTSKVKEMKADKGNVIMGSLAEIIAVDQLEFVMVPLKDKLRTQDAKIVNKVKTCLQKIGNALERNENISIEHKSIFIYGILNEKIKELSDKKDNSSKAKDKQIKAPKDSFLLEPEPRRVGFMPKTSHKVTSHVLVEFALNLLFNLLKRNHFLPTDKKHLGLLDAYVTLIGACLLSEYPEVSIHALHVLSYLIRLPLPSLKSNLPKISGQMFVILNKFASSGLTKGKLFELVQLDFKVIALMIKEAPFYKLDPEHAKVLLFYARNNLEDINQHHSSFIILHAIMRRKVNAIELHELMKTVKDMSVMSTNCNMLDQARRTYLNYVMTYRKKKKWQQELLLFYANNVSYSILEGRVAAAVMLNDLITKLPRELFNHDVEMALWFKLSEQIVQEESKENKALLQRILKSLFLKSERKSVFVDNCVKLLEEDLMKSNVNNSLLIHMSAQSLSSFLVVTVGEHPPAVFDAVLPKVVALLHSSRYHLSLEDADESDSYDVKCLDLTLNSLLDLFVKLMDMYCTKKNLSKWSDLVGEEVWKYIQDHLLYPNLKVRLTSAAILGKLFALYPVEQENSPSIASSPEKVENLVIDLCEQLNTECPIESPQLVELGMAVVRNLIYLIRQSRKIPIKLNKSNRLSLTNEPDATRGPQEEPSANVELPEFMEEDFLATCDESSYLEGVFWVLHRVGVMAYDELRKKGKSATFRRECLLNLIAGIIVVLDEEFVKADSLVSFVICHLTRELSDRNLPEPLAVRTKEVADLLREKIGVERFSELTVRTKAALEAKRTERKAKTRERIMSNPALASKKKAKKQAAKKESRKRKLKELKLRPTNRRVLKNLAIVKT